MLRRMTRRQFSAIALAAPSLVAAPTAFRPIFDGKTLDGWGQGQPNSARWTVHNGAIRGEGLEDRQSYLIWTGNESLTDFELKFEYRMITDGNTGVDLRARIDKTGKRAYEGYHADLGHIGIGENILGAWDFHFAKRKEFPCPRGTRLMIDHAGVGHPQPIDGAVTLADIKRRDWNAVHVIVRGNRFQFFLNSKPASEFTDNHPEPLERGFIGLQIHDAGMIVEFREIALSSK